MNSGFSFPAIDWESIYNHPWQSQGAVRIEKSHSDFWNGRADGFAKKAHHPEHRRLVEELLEKFDWSSEESVLDVGAGPGTYAIPLSSRVGSVTALDVSQKMLEELKVQAELEKRDNIHVLQGAWLATDTDAMPVFDTVICFNALGVAALQEDGSCHMGRTIDKLRDVARRGMVLVPHADLPADKPMQQALGLTESFVRRERIAMLYHIMVKHGLMANIEILPRPFFWTFASLGEAVDGIGDRIGIAGDLQKMKILAGHLSERMERLGDSFVLQYPVSQALFSWNREDF